MIGAIFPLVAAFAHEKGIPLRVDRDDARRQGIEPTRYAARAVFPAPFMAMRSPSLFVPFWMPPRSVVTVRWRS
jgi:predicted glycoside hydrolase/deacetylase ChbG (UPF0249 family)